jgi:hypothetical protein
MAVPDILSKRLRLPVIASPMFVVSGPDLVIAQCKAGMIGAFPALNARPAPVLGEWLERITTELKGHDEKHPERPSAPFAVNQIVHKSNDRLSHDLDVCVKYRVPIVITSLGAREDVNQAVHSCGGIVLHDVINQFFARKAIEKGADGLILLPPARVATPGLCLHSHFWRRPGGGSTVRSCFREQSGPAERLLPRRRPAPTLPMSARPSSPRTRLMPVPLTNRASSTARRRTSFTRTCSPACTATICVPRSWRRGLIPTICR